jgi:uncharacterized protein YraI
MYRKQLLIVSIVVLSLMLTVIAPAMAQDSTATPAPTAQATTAPALTASTGFFATADFRVNVRSGPGTQYTILGQVRSADAVDITGRSENSQWLRVNFNGQEGWVSAALFTVTGDVATASVAEAGATAVLRNPTGSTGGASTTTGASGDVVVVTRVNSNMRSAPSITADLITTIPFNTTLTVIGRNENNNWVQVTYENQTGWISSGLLTFQLGNIDNVTPLDASGNPIQATEEPTAAPAQPTAQPTAAPTATSAP